MANAMPEYGGTVLRPGASGPDIALVQRWLGGLNVDGRYGTSTEPQCGGSSGNRG